MITSTAATVEERAHSGRIDGAIASFLTELQTAGYTKESVRNKRTVVRKFADWLDRRHIPVEAIGEAHLTAFLKRPPGSHSQRSSYKRAALSGFLDYLRQVGLTPRPAPPAAAPGYDLLQQYIEYLHRDRGLADHTVLLYVPFVREWLRYQVARTSSASPDAFDASMIQHFLVEHTRNRSREYARLLAPALRFVPAIPVSAGVPVHGPLASGPDGLSSTEHHDPRVALA